MGLFKHTLITVKAHIEVYNLSKKKRIYLVKCSSLEFIDLANYNVYGHTEWLF